MTKGGDRMKAKKIDWTQGSASLIIMMAMALLAVALLVLYMTITNITYANTIACTRTDAIADSAAIYAQSYDYKYNKAQADIMTTLLTAYNNAASDYYNLTAVLLFPEDDVLTVKSYAATPAFYPDLMGTEQIYGRCETSVKSVDIWGDVLVVPDEIGNQQHEAPDTPPNSGDADAVAP